MQCAWLRIEKGNAFSTTRTGPLLWIAWTRAGSCCTLQSSSCAWTAVGFNPLCRGIPPSRTVGSAHSLILPACHCTAPVEPSFVGFDPQSRGGSGREGSGDSFPTMSSLCATVSVAPCSIVKMKEATISSVQCSSSSPIYLRRVQAVGGVVLSRQWSLATVALRKSSGVSSISILGRPSKSLVVRGATAEDVEAEKEMIELDAMERMEKILEATNSTFNTVRTGRASPSLLDRVQVQDLTTQLNCIRSWNTKSFGRFSLSYDAIECKVEYYGTNVILKSIAQVSTPDGSTILVTPFDKSSLTSIEKALVKLDVGITPNNDGNVIRLNVPQLTADRRKELLKLVSKLTEDGKVAIRNVMSDAIKWFEKLEKERKLSEDNVKDLSRNIQKITDEYIRKIETLSKQKEKGISDVEARPSETSAQSALERAMAYRNMKALSNSSPSASPSSSSQHQTKFSPLGVPSSPVKVEILTGTPIQSRTPSSTNADDAGASPYSSIGGEVPAIPSGLSNSSWNSEDGKDNGSAQALSAFERAKEYKIQQSEMIAALNAKRSGPPEAQSTSTSSAEEEEENVVEIEIHTRDGIVRRKVLKPETAFANVRDIKRKGVSTLDFVGMGFADKKSSTSRPAGLSESFEAPSGPLPEVEMLTRDAGVANPDTVVEGTDVYKPRVATWGMFPRPADISKAYGGGRTIKPGQTLETEEEKRRRESKTKKLLDDYKKRLGLDMAPKDRARFQEIYKNGQVLMDKGQLREAQATFITLMNEMSSASELHGMAALQEAVCLDSLSRSDEAKIKYEKLVSHPNGAVRKKARQLLFGFQAAERLKIRAGSSWDGSSYRQYFDTFADGYNTAYHKSEAESADDEDSLVQTLPYALLLLVPIILIFTLVVLRHA